MAAVKIDPMNLPGPWADGYVLERQQTLAGEFLGHDSFGNPQFDTRRTELGELVFHLKNRNEKNTLDPIADTAVQFIKGWAPPFDLIVPVPPSRKRLTYARANTASNPNWTRYGGHHVSARFGSCAEAR